MVTGTVDFVIIILNLLIGFIAIIYGSEIIIEGLIYISEVLNIPEANIGTFTIQSWDSGNNYWADVHSFDFCLVCFCI